MKTFAKVITAACIFSFPSFAFAAPWSIDADHSSVGFKVRHMMVSNVKGDFRKFSGIVDIDDNDLSTMKIDVTIDVASINTGVTKRDEHLKAGEFFDVAKFPTMTFVSRKAKKTGTDRLSVEGQLTLHGVTKNVVLDVEGPTKAFKDPWGNLKRGATATAKINRKDFGLTWNKAIETGGVMVGDDVNIAIEVELQKK